MTGKTSQSVNSSLCRIENDRSRSVKIMAVGEPAEWLRSGNVPPSEGIAFVKFEEITEETLAHYQPETIYSPILAKTFDCIELAMILHMCGFSGQYRAMASNLPNPDLIEREVRQLCPQLDFKISASV